MTTQTPTPEGTFDFETIRDHDSYTAVKAVEDTFDGEAVIAAVKWWVNHEDTRNVNIRKGNISTTVEDVEDLTFEVADGRPVVYIKGENDTVVETIHPDAEIHFRKSATLMGDGPDYHPVEIPTFEDDAAATDGGRDPMTIEEFVDYLNARTGNFHAYADDNRIANGDEPDSVAVEVGTSGSFHQVIRYAHGTAWEVADFKTYKTDGMGDERTKVVFVGPDNAKYLFGDEDTVERRVNHFRDLAGVDDEDDASE